MVDIARLLDAPLVHLRPDKVPQQSLAEIAQRPFLFPHENITSAACQNPATIRTDSSRPRLSASIPGQEWLHYAGLPPADLHRVGASIATPSS
jgi:hypothetical protein